MCADFCYYSFLAKTAPSRGDFTLYSGGFLRAPPGSQLDTDSLSTDDQKSAKTEKLAGLTDKGHFLTLIVGRGLNSKDASKYLFLFLFLNLA